MEIAGQLGWKWGGNLCPSASAEMERRGDGWRCAMHPAAQWRSSPDLDFLLLWNYLGHIDVFLFSRGGSLEFIAFVGFGWCFPSLPADLLILPLCLRLWCLQRFSLCTLEGLCCLLVLCSSGGRKPLPLSTFLLQRTLLLSEVAGRKTFCKAESSWLPWSFGTK